MNRRIRGKPPPSAEFRFRSGGRRDEHRSHPPLEDNLTVDEAIAHIRREMEDKESPYYGYVVDEHDLLDRSSFLR